MEEKVDVLLTTYNTNIKYLKEQIDSILNQTYTNIHLIISDDNSSNEEVKQVLKDYEKQDKRITLYLQEHNLGYNKNFEFLLGKSDAKYIAFSDHDDIWNADKIEKCLKKLIKENVDMVYCNSTQIDENGNILHNDYLKYKNVPLIKGKSHLAISRCIGTGCSQLITKKVKEEMLPFKNSVMAHDWLAAFVSNENKGITYIEDTLFDYRLHQNNVFGGRSLNQNLSIWKERNGSDYKSYLKYRKERVINQAYLDGTIMCLDYCNNENNKIFINKLIHYYENLKETKYINFHIIKYFRFLYGKNLFRQMIKEVAIFHFPIFGYIMFKNI